jgi:hypothetical protein
MPPRVVPRASADDQVRRRGQCERFRPVHLHRARLLDRNLRIESRRRFAPRFTLPQFSYISGTFSINEEATQSGDIVLEGGPGGYVLAEFEGTVGTALTGFTGFIASFNNASVAGQTFTLSGVQVGADSIITNDTTHSLSAITSGSVTFTLSPNGAPGVGSLSGFYTLTSLATTLNGTFSGSYTAN